MLRFSALLCCAGLCLAQAPDKPAPPAVEQALRARVTEFYQDQVDGKFRQAEALVAEDAKDFYYAAPKYKYLSFAIQKIDYSESFTRAKVTTMGEGYVAAPGFFDKPIKLPIVTTWKLTDGQWYWYVDQATINQTPFGNITPHPSTEPKAGQESGGFHIPSAEEMKYIFSQVKADKQSVTLKAGESAEVEIANMAAGNVSLALDKPPAGLSAKLNTTSLGAGAKAILTIQAETGAKSGKVTVRVDPTTQQIPIQVNIP